MQDEWESYILTYENGTVTRTQDLEYYPSQRLQLPRNVEVYEIRGGMFGGGIMYYDRHEHEWVEAVYGGHLGNITDVDLRGNIIAITHSHAKRPSVWFNLRIGEFVAKP